MTASIPLFSLTTRVTCKRDIPLTPPSSCCFYRPGNALSAPSSHRKASASWAVYFCTFIHVGNVQRKNRKNIFLFHKYEWKGSFLRLVPIWCNFPNGLIWPAREKNKSHSILRGNMNFILWFSSSGLISRSHFREVRKGGEGVGGCR